MDTSSVQMPVAAVVAAAGFSRRMGHFKPLLPWGSGTIIEAVVGALAAASPLLVISGHRGDEIANCLAASVAQVIPNPEYASHEMLRSYQIGVQALLNGQIAANSGGEFLLATGVSGTLLALGDQPHIPAHVIRRLLAKAQETPEAVVIPSHKRRRGHPIYLPRWLFPKLLTLRKDQSLRDLLNGHAEAFGVISTHTRDKRKLDPQTRQIVYVELDTDSIRRDMDVPAEYEALRAEFGQNEQNSRPFERLSG